MKCSSILGSFNKQYLVSILLFFERGVFQKILHYNHFRLAIIDFALFFLFLAHTVCGRAAVKALFPTLPNISRLRTISWFRFQSPRDVFTKLLHAFEAPPPPDQKHIVQVQKPFSRHLSLISTTIDIVKGLNYNTNDVLFLRADC